MTYFRLLRSTRRIWILAAALRSLSRDSARAAFASFFAASLAARSRAESERVFRFAVMASVFIFIFFTGGALGQFTVSFSLGLLFRVGGCVSCWSPTGLKGSSGMGRGRGMGGAAGFRTRIE